MRSVKIIFLSRKFSTCDIRNPRAGYDHILLRSWSMAYNTHHHLASADPASQLCISDHSVTNPTGARGEVEHASGRDAQRHCHACLSWLQLCSSDFYIAICSLKGETIQHEHMYSCSARQRQVVWLSVFLLEYPAYTNQFNRCLKSPNVQINPQRTCPSRSSKAP